jgi:hypothetical protein|tara:strand:- start:25014 stop:25295 length:282 start_codon:yes stop_codon:yes gene_type:complete
MRNKIAGTKTGASRSAKYYQENPEARAKKESYDREYHSTEERKKYRANLNKKNREKGTYGNGDKKDVAHKSKTKTRMQSQSSNRADKKNNFFK